MPTEQDLARAYALLEEDPLRNVVTLKMLNSHSQDMSIRLLQEGHDWALLSLLPVSVSEWDRKTYPDANLAVFIDGSNTELMGILFDTIPKTTVVIKTGDGFLKQRIARQPHATRTTAYLSFTTERTSGSRIPHPAVRQSDAYDERAWQLFLRNGYGPDELSRHFQNGARWFSIDRGGSRVAVCLVFQNYKQIWEIAGVHTEPEFRGQGLARSVVLSALAYLEVRGLVPRYQARWNNHGSIRLAESCGLSEFLRVDHFLLRPAEP